MAGSGKIRLERGGIRGLEKQAGDALVAAARELLADVQASGAVPEESGTMKNAQTRAEVRGEAGQVRIVTEAAQAERLYFEPGYARSDWFAPWVRGKRRGDVVRYFGSAMRE